MTSPILQAAARPFVPVALLYSWFLLARGHNAPGGGFAGGLVGASAVALFAVTFGVAAARRLLPVEPPTLIGVGLGLALASGLAGPLTGGEFLEGRWLAGNLAGLGAVAVGTPLLFDLGVYLLVVGAASLVILALAEER